MSNNTLATPRATAGFDVNAHFRPAMKELGLSPEDTGGTIAFVGEDPIFPSAHRLGACIGIPIMRGRQVLPISGASAAAAART